MTIVRKVHSVYVYPYFLNNLPPRPKTGPVTPYPVPQMIEAGQWPGTTTKICLHICHCCFEPFPDRGAYAAHMRACQRPAGEVVYTDAARHLRVHELHTHGDNMIAVKLACLMSTLVPDKTVSWGVSTFSFYVLYRTDDEFPRLIGAFSVQPVAPHWDAVENALSVFMVLPPYRRRGYGTFFVDLSRHLARERGCRAMTVERPLSEEGLRAHLRVWRRECVRAIDAVAEREGVDAVKLATVAVEAGMFLEDVVTTLAGMEVLRAGEDGAVLHLTHEHRQRYARGDHQLFDPNFVSYTPILRAQDKPSIVARSSHALSSDEEDEKKSTSPNSPAESTQPRRRGRPRGPARKDDT